MLKNWDRVKHVSYPLNTFSSYEHKSECQCWSARPYASIKPTSKAVGMLLSDSGLTQITLQALKKENWSYDSKNLYIWNKFHCTQTCFCKNNLLQNLIKWLALSKRGGSVVWCWFSCSSYNNSKASLCLQWSPPFHMKIIVGHCNMHVIIINWVYRYKYIYIYNI